MHAVNLRVAVNGLISADNAAYLQWFVLYAAHAISLVAAHGGSVVGIAHILLIKLFIIGDVGGWNKRQEIGKWLMKVGKSEENVKDCLLLIWGF